MNLPLDSSQDVTLENNEFTPEALFEGDCGQLSLAARRVLVQLLAGPFLDAKRHNKLWPILLTFEAAIRSHLSELFLELIIDQEQQVAFIRQADTGELETPILLRRTHLTFIDSVLMLYLRQLLCESDTQDARAVVSENDIHEQLMSYDKASSTDKAGFKKRINAAIENARKRSILSRISGSIDRYEISPVLKLLFSADEVIALKQYYTELLKNSSIEDERNIEDAVDE